MNTKQKIKYKRINILYSLLMFVAFLSTFLIGSLSSTLASRITCLAGATSTPSSEVADTTFMYSPTSAVKSGEQLLVLDDYSKSIIKLSNGEILQGENSVSSSYNASHMFSLGQKIVLLSLSSILTSKLIIALDSNTLEQTYVEFLGDEITLPRKYDYISAYNTGDSLYILLYSLSQSSGIESMLYMNIQETNSGIEISRLREINSSKFQNNFSENVLSINILYDTNTSLPVCLINSTSEVLAVYIENNSDEISKLNATEISADELTITRNFFITQINSQPYVVMAKENTIDLHALHIPEVSVVDDKFSLDENPLNLDISLSSIDGITATDTELLICSKSEQKVYSVNITTSGENISFSNILSFQNPNVESKLLNSDEIKLMEVTSDTSVSLLPLPYSMDGIKSITPESCVVEIGYGLINYGEQVVNSGDENANIVQGYNYYMANVNGTNYYGYLPISAVSEIETTESNLPYAFAKKNINVYKYPSATEDDTNTIIYTTTEIEKMEIVRDISNFSYTVGSANALRSFYCVRVNDEIGYIESSDIDRFPEVTLVQTNAEIIRGTAVYAQISDDLPTWNLIAGKRVRILENRFGTEKWTKIAFNDDDGVTCTGYVLADSIQADSWSTLQIIGFVLVLISLVLLVIILIIRNRVNHE